MLFALRPVLALLLAFAFLQLAPSTTAADDALAEKFAAIRNEPAYESAHWGLLVCDLASGEVLYEYQPDKLFAPASTTKLYTVAAALSAFGPDYRFETPLVRTGKVTEAGQLEGDLILIASGDPTLGGRTTESGEIAFTNHDHTYAAGSKNTELTEPDPLAGIEALARQVADSGIKHIAGEVIIDDRLFERESSTGSGPSLLTPIMVNDNLIDIIVRPGEVGGPPIVERRPRSDTYAIDCQATTVAVGGEYKLTIRSNGMETIISGTLPVDHAPILSVQEVPDPAAHARALLIDALARAGVMTDASPTAGNPVERLPAQDMTSALPRVAVLTSPPFSEEARLILKVSHNLHASTMPLLLAARDGQKSLRAGLRREAELLKELGVDVTKISFGGGAGGSRADYITPRATLDLLRHMSTRVDFDVYLRALPILGVDGTLADVVAADSPAHGKVQAKTGTLYWQNNLDGGYLLQSKALAGYMTAASGRRLVFALFVNNAHLDNSDGTGEVGRTLGRVCEKIHESL